MSSNNLVQQLQGVVGRRHVCLSNIRKAPYCKGFRTGRGSALLVVRPGSLIELWRVLSACVAARAAIIMQAANTGLTGGSTPLASYDRNAVVISTLRIDRVVPIRQGTQVVCLAGATLQQLEKTLLPFERQPHSVLGSSCIGASIVGGICNNSGGALVERGPAYTEYALFARISTSGQLELVNSLGIRLGDSPEDILERLDSGAIRDGDVTDNSKLASDREYVERIRDVEATEPSRYNADKRRLFDASGCSGKLAVFAVRLDTFEQYKTEKTYLLSTNNPEDFTDLRRDILTKSANLPVSAEYIHRQTLDLSLRYGNDTVWLIDKLGTRRIPFLFRLRKQVDVFVDRFTERSETLVDRLLQLLCRLLPTRISPRLAQVIRDHDHHLILKFHGAGIEEFEELLANTGDAAGFTYSRCGTREAELLWLYRFAAAGAAIRYDSCHRQKVEGVVALDVALPRNERDWFETLPPALDARIETKLYYGHFLCHVLHQDYLVRKGEDCEQVKRELLHLLKSRGAKYPAEHNHGHTYDAPQHVKAFYREADPTNTLNPGVGGMSTHEYYGSSMKEV